MFEYNADHQSKVRKFKVHNNSFKQTVYLSEASSETIREQATRKKFLWGFLWIRLQERLLLYMYFGKLSN